MGSLGLVVGIGLALAAKVFYVYVDPLIVAIDEALPGANCGGCGYPGCSSNAEAIAMGKSSPDSCVAAGSDVAQAIAALMGVSVEATEPDIALPGCTYGVPKADTKYIYNGVNDCRAVALLAGGMKVCEIGCLGFGTCERVCPFNAISMGPDGLPVVDEERCTGCGTCERACPKHIITLSSVTRRILKEYTVADCTTPCQRRCPAGINISAYIGHISQGNYSDAVLVIKERNPFPTVIGRICPRPCEEDCRRQFVDEPVAINFLKRYAADVEMESGQRVLPYKAPQTGRRVAVVGGGVEGLSTAFFTARLGHETKVFEATDQLGGLLRTAIAKERLPNKILEWDIQGVMEMGVDAETGVQLGRDLRLTDLLADGYNAVFLATGGWDSRLTRSPGAREIEAPIPGTCLLLDLVRPRKAEEAGVRIGRSVAILGGGKLALTAAQKAKAGGATSIALVFRESAAEAVANAGAAFDADALAEAGLENLTLHFSQGITRIWGTGNTLTGIELADLSASDGAQRTTLEVDTLVLAAGRFPEMIFVPASGEEAPEEEVSGEEVSGEETAAVKGAVPAGQLAWEGYPPYKPPAFSAESGLYSSGDQMTDYAGAIKAIGGGRRAAASIHRSLYGIDLDLPEGVLTPDVYIQNVDHVEAVRVYPRRIMPVAESRELAAGSELEKGFDEHTARTEAGRCLRCGLICYRHDPSTQDRSKQNTPVQIES
jgi:NADPH-dependent glutamate synthase beta subunit-like oxidoreductase